MIDATDTRVRPVDINATCHNLITDSFTGTAAAVHPLSTRQQLLCRHRQRSHRNPVTAQAFDFEGEMGAVVVSLLFAFARMDYDARRKACMDGIERAREEGKFLGRKKGTTKGKPAMARQLRDRGMTVEHVAKILEVSKRKAQRYLNVEDYGSST